jgi:hypothetical protein
MIGAMPSVVLVRPYRFKKEKKAATLSEALRIQAAKELTRGEGAGGVRCWGSGFIPSSTIRIKVVFAL